MKIPNLHMVCIACLLIAIVSCNSGESGIEKNKTADLIMGQADTAIAMKMDTVNIADNIRSTELEKAVTIPKDIKIRNYFQFMDNLIEELNCNLKHPLTEHIIVHYNSWIIDSLAGFDYYLQMEKGVFIHDLREVVILHEGDVLKIPDSNATMKIIHQLENTVIDVNIPEFKLRILEYDSVKYTFTVRVGRNERKYLKTAGREVSLRTPIGEGKIVRIAKDPYFVNPVNGRPYSNTTRDDGKVTRMPQIPWLEPEIGGIRHGSLIHPTSNPETLGKPSSNGCIGTGEGDAWIIYYHAPLNTRVIFRYDLETMDENGNPLMLKDIYNIKKTSK